MGTTAIIQARMGSSRLPGKVCKTILGRPMLEYEINRLRTCRNIDSIVLATSALAQDTPVAQLGEALGIEVFRGSEDDVLDRYFHAASRSKADPIVRITGDCPLIDPAICDQTIEAFQGNKADYVCTSESIAEGLDCEVFSYDALTKAWTNAALKSEREHVTLYIRNHPELFNCFEYKGERDDSAYRVTVDEPEDFEVVTAILKALFPKFGFNFSFEVIRDYLDSHPEIYTLNSRITRNEGLIKSLEKEGSG